MLPRNTLIVYSTSEFNILIKIDDMVDEFDDYLFWNQNDVIFQDEENKNTNAIIKLHFFTFVVIFSCYLKQTTLPCEVNSNFLCITRK